MDPLTVLRVSDGDVMLVEILCYCCLRVKWQKLPGKFKIDLFL